MNEKLFKKMEEEHLAFLCDLETMSPKDIIEHSYEKVFKDDILLSFENLNLDDEEVQCLLNMDKPLDYLYNEWLSSDVSYMEDLQNVLNYSIREETEQNIHRDLNNKKENEVSDMSKENIPLVVNKPTNINDQEGWKLYHASNNENVRCAGDMNTAMGKHYSTESWSLNTDAVLDDLSGKYSMERITYVTVANVMTFSDDGRMGKQAVDWAADWTLKKFDGNINDVSDKFRYCLLKQNVGLIDIMANKVMKKQNEIETDKSEKKSDLDNLLQKSIGEDDCDVKARIDHFRQQEEADGEMEI